MIVQSLRDKGAVFVEDETEVPEGAMIAFTRTDDPVIVQR